MTATLHDIKTHEPHAKLIEYLEKLLEHARAGRLISAAYTLGWDDDSCTHGWAVDKRTGVRRMGGEMMLLQHDYMMGIMLNDSHSEIRCARFT